MADKLERAFGSVIDALVEEGLLVNGAPGMVETPRRMAKAYRELLGGQKLDPYRHVKFFKTQHDQLIVVRGIRFVSMCEHHLMPFTGVAHVGYIPGEGINGLSKFSRILDDLARRAHTQEELTRLFADFIDSALYGNKGVAVVLVGEHDCVQCRGVRDPGQSMVTSHLTGAFRKNENQARIEFLRMLDVK